MYYRRHSLYDGIEKRRFKNSFRASSHNGLGIGVISEARVEVIKSYL